MLIYKLLNNNSIFIKIINKSIYTNIKNNRIIYSVFIKIIQNNKNIITK